MQITSTAHIKITRSGMNMSYPPVGQLAVAAAEAAAVAAEAAAAACSAAILSASVDVDMVMTKATRT